MVDRQDIDALLIGALYGELSAAEETRLSAHLESHPADKAVLADLTRAREIVRDSRILQVQLDPPQAVSALLVQEAARRAPRLDRKGEGEEREGWFARFVRSLVAHPAMAAAAMLVIVISAAALVTSRKGEHSMETEGVSSAPSMERTMPTGATGAMDATATLATGKLDDGESPGEAESAPGGGVPQQDQYRVTLAEGDGLAAANKADESADDAVRGVRQQVDAKLDAKQGSRPQPAPVATAKPKKRAMSGIELRKEQPMPKDFGGVGGARDRDVGEGFAAAPPEAARGAGSAPSTGRTLRADASPPPPPAAGAPVAKSESAPAATSSTRAMAPAEEKPAEPQVAWARQQHTQVIAQVRAGNCRDAAGLAVTLSNRAPGYYAQNVATDRAVKDCIAYINTEREKDAELRAERARRAKQRADEPSRPAAKPAKAVPTSK